MISRSVKTLETVVLYFEFRGRKYSVTLNIVPGPTSLIISHEDLDSMGRHCKTNYKVIERLQDGYLERLKCKTNYHP